MFSVSRVFCPLLCLAWTSIWLYCHLRKGKEYLEAKGHLSLMFFLINTWYCSYWVCNPCVHYTKQWLCNILFLWMVFRLHKLWYGKKQQEQPQTDLPEDVRMTCLQFTKYHKDQCCQDIVKKRRWEHRVLLIALVKGCWETVLNKHVPWCVEKHTLITIHIPQ